MKIRLHFERWSTAFYLGPFLDWGDWDTYRHDFEIGLCLGPWLAYLEVFFWTKDWSKEEVLDGPREG